MEPGSNTDRALFLLLLKFDMRRMGPHETIAMRICQVLQRAVWALVFIAVPVEVTIGQQQAARVTIRTDFAGGNARVTSNTDGAVHLEPDLRGGRPWFYWYFAATSTRPGVVSFVFPEKVAGFTNGAIGFQGPAISADEGLTWRWMGRDRVDGNSFSWNFLKANQQVRFAVTIPYVQQHLTEFLRKHDMNPHLRSSVLTQSRGKRNVVALQIGSSGPNTKPMLVTARHHAAETMASYVLEGFLHAAMSDDPSGGEFRRKYVLTAIPIVDRDGVEAGDQGKNRRPHDHNRDYGETSIYPEVQAIRELDKQKRFRFALDFHCPTLVMDDHQVMYFVGPKEHPRYNYQNVSELAGWIRRELPKSAPSGPHVWLKTVKAPAPMNSHYFGFKDGTILAATLEFPFAPPSKLTDPDSCRKYGEAILRAWARSEFQ